MKTYPQMRFGAFIPPLHAMDENPTLLLERDIELIQLMDNLAFDEVWVGEHHSSGYETIASPELLIAAAAERTKHIRLGTGVSSLCFHHPFILADRIVQLDHQTRGRLMFGVGPGQLPGDAHMLGISPVEQRRMMAEALEAILALMRGETVTMETDWFRLQEARLQILPYQQPMIECAAAAVLTPSGPSVAGKYGIGMLSLAAGTAAGFGILDQQWKICADVAAQYGQVVDRRNWRVVVPVHVAETREQAIEECKHGIFEKLEYYRKVGGKKGIQEMNLEDFKTPADAVHKWITDNGKPTDGVGPFGIGIVGTPEEVTERLRRFQERAGGFGCFLLLAHNIPSWDATKRSLELFARKVIPALRGSNRARVESLDWSARMADGFMAGRAEGQKRADQDFKKNFTTKSA